MTAEREKEKKREKKEKGRERSTRSSLRDDRTHASVDFCRSTRSKFKKLDEIKMMNLYLLIDQD